MHEAADALKEEIRAAEAQINAMPEGAWQELREATRRQYEAVRELRDICPHERVVERCDDADKGCGNGDPESHLHWRLCTACGRHQEVWLAHPETARSHSFAGERIVPVSDTEFWAVYDTIPGRFITDGDLGWGFDFYWDHLWD